MDFFDKKENSLIVGILLLIPFVGWVIEILVRISAFIRKNSTLNLVGMIIAIIGNWPWQIVDLIVLIVTGKLFLLEE